MLWFVTVRWCAFCWCAIVGVYDVSVSCCVCAFGCVRALFCVCTVVVVIVVVVVCVVVVV